MRSLSPGWAHEFLPDQPINGDNFAVLILLQSTSPLQKLDGVVADDAEDEGGDDVTQFGAHAGGGATDVGEDVPEGLPQAVVTEGSL